MDNTVFTINNYKIPRKKKKQSLPLSVTLTDGLNEILVHGNETFGTALIIRRTETVLQTVWPLNSSSAQQVML